MKIEKMRKIADARINFDDDSVRAVDVLSNMINELAFQKMIDEKIDKLLDVVDAAKEASKEIDNFYTKMTQSSHVQTIAEDDHDLWFHRDRIIMALEALEKE